jgi:hypothetical protein
MKALKQILIITILGFLLVFVLLQLSYNPCDSYRFQMKSKNNHALVIAHEESYFKDSITRILVHHYNTEKLPVKVIPLASLPKIKSKDFSAVVIIHSWYTRNPPREVAQFIKKQRGCLDKILVLTTSSDGTHKMDEVDAITGASKMEEATFYAYKIIEKLKPLVGLNN